LNESANSNESSLASDLRAAVGEPESRRLTVVAEAIDRFVFDAGEFPDALFEQVIQTLQSPALRRRSDSLALVKMFEYQIDLLSTAQRDALALALFDALPEFADEMSAFLGVELLVELWPADRLFKSLKRLSSVAAEPVLLTAVHGFDWLAKRSNDAPIRAACLAELGALARHRTRSVAAEAQEAVRRRSRADLQR
jgi:hypothetical protein